MSKFKVKVIQLIFVLMLATLLKVYEASIPNEIGVKRINKVDIDDSNADVNKARIARYYRSSLILDHTEDMKVAEDMDVMNVKDGEEFPEGFNDPETDNKIHKNSESPVTLIEMPEESEHPLLRKVKEADDVKVNGDNSNSYTLPDKYEYPELVQSLKNVYKEMAITSCLYVLNIVSAVGIVLVNKFIYSYYQFPHGLILTLYHFVLTSIGLQVLAGLKMFPIKPVSLIKVLPLSISFCSYVVLTNLSLQYNSGTFYQVSDLFYAYHDLYCFVLDFGSTCDSLTTIVDLWN